MWNGWKVSLGEHIKKSGKCFPRLTNGSIEMLYLLKKGPVVTPAVPQSYQKPIGFVKNRFQFVVWT